MSEHQEIPHIFRKFQGGLDAEQDIRDAVRRICKETDRLSWEITTLLQVIHHSEEGIAPACVKARKLFKRVNNGYQQLKAVVPEAEYFKFYDHWRAMTQRVCFLISLTIWLEEGVVAQHETVAEVLGLCVSKERRGFYLDPEEYLIGLLNVSSELLRYAVNAASRGYYNRPMEISDFIKQINAGFRFVYLKNESLRKRLDALQQDVKRIEEIVYDVNLRGLKNMKK